MISFEGLDNRLRVIGLESHYACGKSKFNSFLGHTKDFVFTSSLLDDHHKRQFGKIAVICFTRTTG